MFWGGGLIRIKISDVYNSNIDEIKYETVYNNTPNFILDLLSIAKEDTFLYFYFSCGKLYQPSLCVARLNESQIEDSSLPFRYFTQIQKEQPVFDSSYSDAEPLQIDSSISKPFSIIWNPIMMRYMILFSEYLSNKIDINYSINLWGPFSISDTFFTNNETIVDQKGIITSVSVTKEHQSGSEIDCTFSIYGHEYPYETTLSLKYKELFE